MASERVFWLRETDWTLMTASLTLTVQLALRPPSVEVTVTVPVPGAMPVTLPFWATLITLSGLQVQVTDLSVALSGSTVALRVKSSPTVSSCVVSDRRTSETGISFSLVLQEARRRETRARAERKRSVFIAMTSNKICNYSHFPA